MMQMIINNLLAVIDSVCFLSPTVLDNDDGIDKLLVAEKVLNIQLLCKLIQFLATSTTTPFSKEGSLVSFVRDLTK